MERSSELEVAVVGGGVAGLYAAWRLAGSGSHLPATIAVFETHGRVGGRLRSVKLDASLDLVVDLGGIAFHRTHRHVHRLVEHLDLETRGHPIGSRRSLLNLRGRTLPYRKLRYQLVRPFSFRVARRTQIQGVAALLGTAAERVLPGSTSFSLEDWARAFREATFMGRPLRDWPLRAVLSRVLEPEEVRYVEAASGFALFTRAPNAATGLAWNMEELSVGGDLSRLVEGYQILPETLARRVKESGAGVHLQHRLIAIDRKSDFFKLWFQGCDAETVQEISARSVILALPRKAMESISGIAELAGGRAVTGVTPWPVCTIALLYPSAWWASIGIERGRSVTDLPARQLWQFGRSEDRPGLIVSHSDGDDAAFWQALASPGNDAQGFSLMAPESDIVQELHRQVCSVYSPAIRGTIPPPQAGCFQDWGAPAYGGALHVWARGVEPALAIDAAMQPAPDLRLFVCGEAWSKKQGWVEGALGQTETVLQRHFGLQAPTWL